MAHGAAEATLAGPMQVQTAVYEIRSLASWVQSAAEQVRMYVCVCERVCECVNVCV